MEACHGPLTASRGPLASCTAINHDGKKKAGTAWAWAVSPHARLWARLGCIPVLACMLSYASTRASLGPLMRLQAKKIVFFFFLGPLFTWARPGCYGFFRASFSDRIEVLKFQHVNVGTCKYDPEWNPTNGSDLEQLTWCASFGLILYVRSRRILVNLGYVSMVEFKIP